MFKSLEYIKYNQRTKKHHYLLTDSDFNSKLILKHRYLNEIDNKI